MAQHHDELAALLTSASTSPVAFAARASGQASASMLNAFKDLVTDQAAADLEARGLARVLDTADLRTYRDGIDPPLPGGRPVAPTVEDIARVEDLARRAFLLWAFAYPPLSPLGRQLIESVADASMFGIAVQSRLKPSLPAMAKRKPHKANRSRQTPLAFPTGSLFDLADEAGSPVGTESPEKGGRNG
jgi:hypothetical protein